MCGSTPSMPAQQPVVVQNPVSPLQSPENFSTAANESTTQVNSQTNKKNSLVIDPTTSGSGLSAPT